MFEVTFTRNGPDEIRVRWRDAHGYDQTDVHHKGDPLFEVYDELTEVETQNNEHALDELGASE